MSIAGASSAFKIWEEIEISEIFIKKMQEKTDFWSFKVKLF